MLPPPPGRLDLVIERSGNGLSVGIGLEDRLEVTVYLINPFKISAN